jgi:hypothetical protein
LAVANHSVEEIDRVDLREQREVEAEQKRTEENRREATDYATG